MSEQLADNNIRAVPCRDGQTMGKEIDVRVFDIQHIKGLKFEAVFFVGVDRLAASQPELFDKYLYVGTTRAATPDGHPNSPTCGHLKLPHPERGVTMG